MTDPTIPTQSPSRNQEDQREAEKAARIASFIENGYEPIPEKPGFWRLKPKEPRNPSIPPQAETSRQFLYLPEEDYSDTVCLLLPGGHATLIDVRMYDWAISFDWQVLGRSIFYVERTLVTYTRRRCGIGRTGYGNFRSPAKTKMVNFTRELFTAGFVNDTERWNAIRLMRGKDIDHRNRRPWDHRWDNLRIATRSDNMHNKAPAKGKSSKYKGVTKIKGRERWTAHITIRGKTRYLGTFDDEFKAAQAYNAAVRKYCPEFGYINPLGC
jgi:hypothetical protein